MSDTAERILDPASREFYIHTLCTLRDAGIPYLLGGAYAFECYTGIARHTKDLDVFVRPADVDRALAVLANVGYYTELTFPHWLGKAYCDDKFADLIFKSGNGLAEVHDTWFEHAEEDEVLGVPVKLLPAEEMLWTKLFIMERERFDGADVAHLLRARADRFDWPRLLSHLGEQWRVLLSHLILFGFIYPSERNRIPQWVMRDLIQRLDQELDAPPPAGHVCQGTFLSREQYLIDIESWGYRDARIEPIGTMTPEETAQWTAAIEEQE